MSKSKKLLPIKTVEGKTTRIGFLAHLADRGGCGILRTVTPYLLLEYLRIPKISIHATYLSQYVGDLNFYRNYSFIQFQRSATKNHLKLHREFRSKIKTKHHIPLIYEIDDLLTTIPEWNFAHQYYKDNLEYIEIMMRESDGIAVSTYPLKKVYSKYNKNIKVVPNHLAKFIWGDIEPKHERYESGDKIRIIWAGSQNHFKHPMMRTSIDGGDFGSKLMEFIKKTTDVYEWVFMGALPIELEEVRDKIEFHIWQNTFEYPKYLKSLNADIGIAPLQKGLFNDCKSSIKALEFTASGIPGIYSNVAPYNLMKIKCDTEEYMIDRIETLAKDIDLREKIWKEDYRTLKGQLWWEEDNNLKKYVSTYLSFMGLKLP